MAFPLNPNDGDLYTTSLGTRYYYDATRVAWLIVAGVTGIQGPTGPQGQTGVQGQTGIQGQTGVQGQTGLIGLTGVQGQTGVRGVTGISFPRYQYFADQLDNPVNSSWAVNALAPVITDASTATLKVRAFDDTTPEGVGFIVETPSGSSNILLNIRSRAATAPDSSQTVGVALYAREVPDNGSVEDWSAKYVLTNIDIPTNSNFQYDSETIPYTSLDMTAGRVTQFEFIRDASAAADTLSGDWYLLELGVSFS